MNTSAIILAAGMGTRLGRYTEGLPKCMLPFLGKPLIEWQVESLRESGIEDITVVRGYAADKISIEGVRYSCNPEFASTNMVWTLMSAREQFLSGNDILVSYADIVYQPRLVGTLQASHASAAVLADKDWIPYWMARSDDWHNDVESLQFDREDRLTEIGTPRCPPALCQARYIGLLKFSPEGAAAFSTAFDENAARFRDDPRPWRRSRSFRQAYMTCMLQELVERRVDVRVVKEHGGWLEFDTEDDYERANSWRDEGSLGRFIELRR